MSSTGAPGPAAAPAAPAPSASGPYQPRGRWAEQSDPQAIRSLLETRSLQLALTPSPQRADGGEGGGDGEGEEVDDSHFHPQSLDSLMDEEEGIEEEEELEGEEEEDEEDEENMKVGFDC